MIGLGLGGRTLGVVLGQRQLPTEEIPAEWYRAGGAPAPVAAYQPKGAASLAASYVNLANPGTYDLTLGVAPTFNAATGWFFNQSAWLMTGWIPASDQCSVLLRGSGFETWSSGYVYGSTDYQNLRHQLAFANPGCFYANGGTGYTQTAYAAGGVIGFAGQQGYLNGTADGAATAGGNIPQTATVIGAAGIDNGAGWPTWGYVQAVVMYASVLTAGQMAAVSAAMAAL